MVGLCPPFAHFVTFRYSRAVSGRPFDRALPWRWGSPPPQGSSLGCKLCCLAPSSLNRPHPPHPRAHCDFTAWRLIRNAFAVRERRGDPRVVPGFRCPFLPNMPSSLTPGSSIIVWSRTSMSTWPSPSSEQLGTPDPPAIRFTRGPSFGASWFTHLLRPVRLLALLYGSDRYARPPRAFTSRLPTDRSPSPLLGITTTATGLLCWRDLHPLEWQLASLHQNRTCGFPAYGSHLGCMTAIACRIRSSACDTRAWLWVQYVLCWCAFPLAPALRSTDSAALAPADASAVGFLRFVRRLHCYYDEVRLLGSVHHRLRLLAFPMRTAVHTRHATTAARHEISQVPVRSLCT